MSDKISFYDIVSGNKITEIENKGFESLHLFSQSNWLIAANSKAILTCNLETMETNTTTTNLNVVIMHVLGDNMIVCFERHDFRVSGVISFWSFEKKMLKKNFELQLSHSDTCKDLVALPNRKIAIACLNEVKIYDYDKKEYLLVLNKVVSSIYYLRDSLVALYDDKLILIYDFESGDIVYTIKDIPKVYSILALKEVFLIGSDNALLVFDIQSFKKILTKMTHNTLKEKGKIEGLQSCGKNRFIFRDRACELIQIFDLNKLSDSSRW